MINVLKIKKIFLIFKLKKKKKINNKIFKTKIIYNLFKDIGNQKMMKQIIMKITHKLMNNKMKNLTQNQKVVKQIVILQI